MIDLKTHEKTGSILVKGKINGLMIHDASDQIKLGNPIVSSGGVTVIRLINFSGDILINEEQQDVQKT